MYRDARVQVARLCQLCVSFSAQKHVRRFPRKSGEMLQYTPTSETDDILQDRTRQSSICRQV
jgi:hypothetical protein